MSKEKTIVCTPSRESSRRRGGRTELKYTRGSEDKQTRHNRTADPTNPCFDGDAAFRCRGTVSTTSRLITMNCYSHSFTGMTVGVKTWQSSCHALLCNEFHYFLDATTTQTHLLLLNEATRQNTKTRPFYFFKRKTTNVSETISTLRYWRVFTLEPVVNLFQHHKWFALKCTESLNFKTSYTMDLRDFDKQPSWRGALLVFVTRFLNWWPCEWTI